MKSALLTAAWNADDWTFEALEAHYKTLVRYLNLEDMGNGAGLWLRHAVLDEAFPVSGAGVPPGKRAVK